MTIVKVFVLGRPGSGKSTAIQHITRLAAHRNIPTTYIRDYTILREMFEQDIEHKRFQPAAWDGFDITDFTVLDEALQKVEEKIRGLAALSQGQDKIVLIEFARNDYYHALHNFTNKFLRNTYFLFIDAELEVGIERIHKRRTNNSLNEDRHSISDYIMRTYYATHNWSATLQKFTFDGQKLQHVTTLDNSGSKGMFEQRITSFAKGLFDEMIIRRESYCILV